MMASRGTTGLAKLRMAIPKGALFDGAVALVAEAGLPCDGLAEPGRQLVIDCDWLQYVIGKPTDIPAYVAYGAADLAVAGKDVLVESGLDVVELADLGFGDCRFVVAEPKDARTAERYRHVGVIRVATKYPAIAEAHFAARGVQAEIIRLSGNIEIAPLIGLADQIVDITATGRTLEENDLRVVEEVMPSTARLVANPTSLRAKADVIEDVVARLVRASE